MGGDMFDDMFKALAVVAVVGGVVVLVVGVGVGYGLHAWIARP